MSEPKGVLDTREEVNTTYRCSFCGASRRADVFWERIEKFEIKVEIECRAFLKGGKEVCGHTEIRYMAG